MTNHAHILLRSGPYGLSKFTTNSRTSSRFPYFKMRNLRENSPLLGDVWHRQECGMKNAFIFPKNLDLYISIIYTSDRWKNYLNNFQVSSGIEVIYIRTSSSMMWKTGNANRYFLTDLFLSLKTQSILLLKNDGLLLGKQMQIGFLSLYLPRGIT